MLTFRFSRADGQMTQTETLTTGMVGKEVKLEFTEDWADFSKTAVFTAGEESRDVMVRGDVVVIPHEVLTESGLCLYVGIYGVAADGRVTPTIRVQGPEIYPGADPEGVESREQTLPVWAQHQLAIDLNGQLIDITRQLAEQNRQRIDQQQAELDGVGQQIDQQQAELEQVRQEIGRQQQDLGQIRQEVDQLRQDGTDDDSVCVTDDGDGNISILVRGDAGITHDGAGNITITIGGV